MGNDQAKKSKLLQTELENLKPFSSTSKYRRYFAHYSKTHKICIVKNGTSICGQLISHKDGATSGLINHLKSHSVDPAMLKPLKAALKPGQ